MISPTTNQFQTTQHQTFSSGLPPVAYTAGHAETFATQRVTTTSNPVQVIDYQPAGGFNYQVTGPSGGMVQTQFNGGGVGVGGGVGGGGFTQTKNVTSLESFNTTPALNLPKGILEPTHTHRTLLSQEATAFPPYPVRPSTPPNAGYGFGQGQGMCGNCCSCFGNSGSVGVGMNPGMNMGMGMNTGCCSRLCGGGMGGGSCGGGGMGGGMCCPGGGMGMRGGTGCCGPTCCPFGGSGMGGMPPPGGFSTPMMGGGIGTPVMGSTTAFGPTMTPGIAPTPGFGGAMEYSAGAYGPGLGTTGCCFCPECARSNGCCACLSSPDCCCMF